MTTAREKHIQYAQIRRDNENEAREELERRLPEPSLELNSRGDLTKPAKSMIAALLYFAPDTEIGKPVSRRDFGEGRSKEYAKLRRDNEVEAREALTGLMPKDLQNLYSERTDFNQTTKVIIAAAKYFDLLNGAARTKEEGRGACERRGYRYMKPSGEKTDGEQQTVVVTPRVTQSSVRTDADQKLVSETPLPLPSPSEISDFINEMESADARKTAKPATPTKTTTPSSRGKKRIREDGENDILTDLRRDEKEQEGLALDVKPPSRTRSGGVKTVHPFVESTKKLKKARFSSPPLAELNPSTIPELQALQATATRLVQKAEEVAVANGGVQGGLKTIVADAHDFMIDLISVLEQGGEKQRETKKKWDARKKEWQEEGVEFQEG